MCFDQRLKQGGVILAGEMRATRREIPSGRRPWNPTLQNAKGGIPGKHQKEIPVFWLKIFVCSAVSTTGPTQANALLGAVKLVYGVQETVIP